MHEGHDLVIIPVFLIKIHKEQREHGWALARCLDVLLNVITIIHDLLVTSKKDQWQH